MIQGNEIQKQQKSRKKCFEPEVLHHTHHTHAFFIAIHLAHLLFLNIFFLYFSQKSRTNTLMQSHSQKPFTIRNRKPKRQNKYKISQFQFDL